MTLRARKVSGTFEKRASVPAVLSVVNSQSHNLISDILFLHTASLKSRCFLFIFIILVFILDLD